MLDLRSVPSLAIEHAETGSTQPKVSHVPEWAKSVVWYEITPETFRDGDGNNQPTWAMQDHYYPGLSKSWRVHPWGADRYALADYEAENGQPLSYNNERRRHGGDIQGVIDKLDYLAELGIGAIYMMPVFYAYSFHKYNAVCYHHIDPYLGPDPEGDKALISQEVPDDPKTWVWTQADRLGIKLIEAAHNRNIRIIFDGPFNHVGLDCFAFQDVLKNQMKSRFANWFTIYSWANPHKNKPLDWKPFLNEKTYAAVRKDQKAPNDYIMASTERWMKPVINGETHSGLDGWRLDCADFIPHKFWKDWCKYVRSLNPQAYIMGEVAKPFPPYQRYLNAEEFCSIMNYPFKKMVEKYFINRKIKTSKFDKELRKARNSVPQDVNYVLYNLIDSHDTERITSRIVNPCITKHGDARDFGSPVLTGLTGAFNTRKPTLQEYGILKLITIFQMTYMGAPAFYYGDEVGMWGPAWNFKPMIWEDIQYENERYIPDGSVQGAGNRIAKDDKVEINGDLFRHFQKLIKIRNANLALRLGDFKTVITDDGKGIFAYLRTYQNETILVVLNNGDTSQMVKIDTSGSYQDLLNEGDRYQAKDGGIVVEVPAKWGVILKKDLQG